MYTLTEEYLNSYPPIFQNIYHGQLDAVYEYIAGGNDLTAKVRMRPLGDREMGLVAFASLYGQFDVVKSLTEAGCDPQADDNDAIRRACQIGSLEIVNYLLSAGCDPKECMSVAIILAAEVGHLDLVNVLIAEGCNIQTMNNHAIRNAADKGHTSVVYALYDAAIAQGNPISRDIYAPVQRILDRRDMINNLPMIFSTLARDYDDSLNNHFAKIANYDGRLREEDMDTLEARTTSAFNILTSKQ